MHGVTVLFFFKCTGVMLPFYMHRTAIAYQFTNTKGFPEMYGCIHCCVNKRSAMSTTWNYGSMIITHVTVGGIKWQTRWEVAPNRILENQSRIPRTWWVCIKRRDTFFTPSPTNATS